MTGADLKQAWLITFDTTTRDDVALLNAVADELTAADALADAVCECVPARCMLPCPYEVARLAYLAAFDRRRSL